MLLLVLLPFNVAIVVHTKVLVLQQHQHQQHTVQVVPIYIARLQFDPSTQLRAICICTLQLACLLSLPPLALPAYCHLKP